MAERKTETRTADKFFANMYRDLRAWNREIPESPQRADPILRILLQLYSNQLADIDGHVGRTWDVATASLIKSMVPEAKRWPVPAFTVMKCETADPLVEIDSHTKFYYKEKREGGQTFFFSAHRTERLLSAQVRHLLLTDGQVIINLMSAKGTTGRRLDLNEKRPGKMLVGIEYDGQPSGFGDAAIFMTGDPDVLRQLRWGRWAPSYAGGFDAGNAFCPGVTTVLEQMFAEADGAVDWGGLRTTGDLFGELEDNWVRIPEKFASVIDKGLHDPALSQLVRGSGVPLAIPAENLYWILVDLAPGGDKTRLTEPISFHFGCFVATNKTELTVFKHTGGNSLVEVELPDPVESIVEIVSVIDSAGEHHLPRHLAQNGAVDRAYIIDERDGRLVLWFDFSSLMEGIPDSLSVTYSVTAGTSANGIAEGRIADLYERHPGIQAAENIAPVKGAIPARTEEQLLTEVSARLRNRDRALSFAEISNWARTFDPRIRRTECRNGIERTKRGVRRCIVVRAGVSREDIYSDDESQLLARRLERFLKSRAPINTHFKAEIVAR